MISKSGIVLVCLGMVFASCVKHEVMFTAQSEIGSDGSFYRQCEMRIRISGDRNIEDDSLNLSNFHNVFLIGMQVLFHTSRKAAAILLCHSTLCFQ